MAQDYEIARLLYLPLGVDEEPGIRNTLQTSSRSGLPRRRPSRPPGGDAGLRRLRLQRRVRRRAVLRNARGATIYEGTSEIHTLIQAGYAFGDRQDAALRYELPAYDPAAWRETP